MAADVPLFNKDKHISYWLRCLKSPLPTVYTSNDANRMTLAYFIISALDLLGVLFTHTSPEERRQYADWIYRCQHPEGGFRAFPGTDFGPRRSSSNAAWDPANLAATYFALSALCVLGNDLSKLDRDGCLSFLRSLQTEDGGFGELKAADGRILGGRDPRFAYMAATVRWILRGSLKVAADAPLDIDLQKLLDWIIRSQVSQVSWNLFLIRGHRLTLPRRETEASLRATHTKRMVRPFLSCYIHVRLTVTAGLTFCAVASLYLLGCEHDLSPNSQHHLDVGSLKILQSSTNGPISPNIRRDATIQWLCSRFTLEIDEDDHIVSDGPVRTSPQTASQQTRPDDVNKFQSGEHSGTSFQKLRSFPARQRQVDGVNPEPAPSFLVSPQSVYFGGFSGRCNKVADTCYAFWAGASLKVSLLHGQLLELITLIANHLCNPLQILGALDLVNIEYIQAYLLEKTQHMVLGGFGKMPGDLPDIYHAYMGLAALSLINGHKRDGNYIGPDIEVTTNLAERQTFMKQSPMPRDDSDRTVRELDPVLCMSTNARQRIESFKWHMQP